MTTSSRKYKPNHTSNTCSSYTLHKFEPIISMASSTFRLGNFRDALHCLHSRSSSRQFLLRSSPFAFACCTVLCDGHCSSVSSIPHLSLLTVRNISFEPEHASFLWILVHTILAEAIEYSQIISFISIHYVWIGSEYWRPPSLRNAQITISPLLSTIFNSSSIEQVSQNLFQLLNVVANLSDFRVHIINVFQSFFFILEAATNYKRDCLSSSSILLALEVFP